MIEIIYQNKDFIVVNKPPLVPSQSDLTGDSDAMTLASEMLKSLGENGKLWLIHRLDRVVGGLLVFARNPKSAAELSRLVRDNELYKGYLAVVEGEAPGGELVDFLYKDSRICRYTLLTSLETKFLGCSSLHRHTIDINAQDIGHRLLHCRNMRVKLWSLRRHS